MSFWDRLRRLREKEVERDAQTQQAIARSEHATDRLDAFIASMKENEEALKRYRRAHHP